MSTIPQLKSVSILYRHGARGPGDSETSAWPEHDPVVTQWKESECENLSSVGVRQIRDLGRWFCLRYVKNETIAAGVISSPNVFFRGSKSDRAVESGRDFISGFNDEYGSEVSCT